MGEGDFAKMMRESHDVRLFEVGEVINPPDYTLRIRVVDLYDDGRIRTEVVQTHPTRRAPFHLGRVLEFRPSHVKRTWLLHSEPGDDLHDRWYVLYVDDRGTKRFEHYR